jgi:uncharacterized protein (TIGR02246 family)
MSTRRLLILGGGLLAVLAGTLGAARTGQPKPPEQVGAPEAGAPAGQEAAKSAIQKQAEAFVEAFHRGDARAVAACWAPDGDYTDPTGRHLKGREAIQKAFEDFFVENKGLKVRIDSLSLRFVTPDVAVEDGTTEVYPADGGPPSRARYSNLHVRKDGRWLLGSVRESALELPGNYEHLRGLEWAVGDWASDSDKGQAERVALAWSDNQNFLVGSFTTTFKNVPVVSATQWIGWDPLAKRVRSWVFDASGAFGEGSWTTADGNKWVIRTSSVLQSGKRATATFILARVDDDTLTLQSRDRTVDGEPLPDTREVRMKRVK